MHRNIIALAAVCAATVSASVPASAQGDPEVIAKIIEEGKTRSQVWKTLEYISHEIGPRLTGSSRVERANVWARDQFTAYGLTNSHLAKWGEIPVRFDRGPSTAKMVTPEVRELEFTTSAWSAGTEGPVRGHVVKEPTTVEEAEGMREQLTGAWVLSKARRQRGGRGADREMRERLQAEAEARAAVDKVIEESGILGKIVGDTRDQITTGGARGWRELSMDSLPEGYEVKIRRSDYDAINSRLSDGERVEVEVDLKHYFTEGPIPVYNTVAEIKGTEFPDEVVIISAHLDSWDGPGSQGTQDNGTGSSVTLETARILMAAGAKPRRTIRFCLWTGEEQGLLGSRAYVENLSEEELGRISACFVDDGGTYYQGGLVCTPDMLPMLQAATAPLAAAFPELPIDHQVQDAMPRGGSSDHASFNRRGVPGFFWTEKHRPGLAGKGYGFSWHTQYDTTEYAIEEYLIQSATCSAVTAYNLAMAETLLPRYIAPPEEEREQGSRPEGRGGRRPAGDATPGEPEGEPGVTADPNFKAVTVPITGKWAGEYTTAGVEFELELAADAAGAVQGSFVMGDSTRKIDKGRWDAATKKLEFEYESSSFGRLTAKATLQDDGSLVGEVKSGPDSEGYPFKATKKAAPAPGGE